MNTGLEIYALKMLCNLSKPVLNSDGFKKITLANFTEHLSLLSEVKESSINIRKDVVDTLIMNKLVEIKVYDFVNFLYIEPTPSGRYVCSMLSHMEYEIRNQYGD
jgi:hypothetical protein